MSDHRSSVPRGLRLTGTNSLVDARAGDVITLDFLGDISDANRWQAVEMVWLVDADTEKIMGASIFEFSVDNEDWVSSQSLSLDLEAKTELPLSGKLCNDRFVRT